MALTKIPSSLLDTSGGFDLQGNITLGDSEKVLFGADSDLQIYHDGNHSYIYDNGTGSLRVLSDAFRVRNTANNASVITGLDGGGVFLYHDGDQKLETTSAGATVTGVLTATSVNTGQGDYELYAMDQNVRTTDSPAFAAATINGTLTVTGDLDITGDINSYNVTDLDVTDKTITLGVGQTEANSGGSGIIIDGSSASILWDETNDEWDFNKNITVAGVIRAQASNPAVQIGDTNGYTFYYTGNSSNRLQLNYDAPLSTGANVLMEADSAGRIVFPDKVQLAANYATASGSTLATISYLYVGSSSDSYNLSLESSRDITNSDGAWASRNELFVLNSHTAGEASIGLSTNGADGSSQHHRAVIIAAQDGTGGASTGKLAFKTRGSSAAESEKERLTIYKDGMIEMFGTKAYGSDLGLLRLRPYLTGTNYSDGGKINIVFGHEAVTNSYIGEVRVTQSNPSTSTASTMEFYTNSGGGNTATKPRMTIMSNGGVEIGDGTNYGYLKVINDSAVVQYLDRRGTDGAVLEIRHADVKDGQINTLSGRIGIGSDDTGIFFDSTRDCISPFTMTGNDGRTAAIDLGRDGVRFKDAYFTGKVNASSLTATDNGDSTGLSLRNTNEFISGEGWCTAHGHYNYNDGTLFLNRNTTDGLHPVFHIAGYNNPTYHPSFSYSNGDAGMVTLVRPDGAKTQGSSYAYKGLSNTSDYSNWIKDASGTWFFDSDSKHQFYGNVDVRQSLSVNSDKSGNEYLYLWQAQGGDGGVLFGDSTGGSRLNWQVVPSTSSRDLMFYSYGMPGHSVKFGAAGGIKSLTDGGTSSAFFLAGETTAAANGKVAIGLRDGMIQFRDPLDYYHKMWYYDGVNVSTNSGHGHFRVWGDSNNSAMNNSSAENTLRLSVDTVNGNIGTSEGGSEIISGSDSRLKTNVQDLPNMLDKINALRPVSFDWKYTSEEEFLYGFIAQEVQEVDDTLVYDYGTTTYRTDKTYDEDLEPDGTIENTLAIYERQLVPMLVKAVQELNTKLEAAEARITELEG